MTHRLRLIKKRRIDNNLRRIDIMGGWIDIIEDDATTPTVQRKTD